MKIELKPWSYVYKEKLKFISNKAERRYLSDRLPKPYTDENADWWLHMVSQQEGKSGVFRAVFADDVLVGNVTVEQKSDVYRKDAELGYLLLPEYYGRGIMTEGVKQICRIAFESLDISRMTGLVYAPNLASRRVLEKNGFLLEGTMRNAVVKNHEIYDLCVYGKLKEEQEA